MGGYHFAHTGTHSIKGNGKSLSVSDVLKEAAREPDHCQHVGNPKPPIVLFGSDPADLLTEVKEVFAERRKEIRATNKDKPKDDRIRNIREDTHLLTSWVYSHPTVPDELADPKLREEYEAWEADGIRSVHADAKRRGITVKSISRHIDEGRVHIHCFGISLDDNRLDAKKTHPGYIAKSEHQAEGKAKASIAYKDAMRTWQDQVHAESGLAHGLARIGPGRARLTRSEWKATQQAAEHAAKVHNNQAEAHQANAEKDRQVAKSMMKSVAARVVIEAYADGRIEDAQTSSTGVKTLRYSKALEGTEKRSLAKKIQPVFDWAWLSIQKWAAERRKELAKHAADIEKTVRSEMAPQLKEIDLLYAEAKEQVAAGSKISRDIEQSQKQLENVRIRVRD